MNLIYKLQSHRAVRFHPTQQYCFIRRSGTILPTLSVIETVANTFHNNDIDALYGDVHFVHPDNLSKSVRYYSSAIFKPSLFRFGFMPAHPSFYMKRECYEKYGLYALDYKISSDFDMLIRYLYKEKIKIFNEAYGSLVFMTACVYKRDNLLEIYNDKISYWISGPLLYSFYSCSKGPMYIIGEPLIIFNPGNASYAGIKRVLKIKFEEYIKILERLVEFGYNRKEVYKTIKNFFKKQSHSHFLYNFVNFSKSAKYYKYYDLKTFFLFANKCCQIYIYKTLVKGCL